MRKIRLLFLSFTIILLSLGTVYIVKLNAHENIEVDTAERLVASWIMANKTTANWKSDPRLREVTTEEIWDRLHVQIFKQMNYTGSVNEAEAYLIKDRKVYPMSIGFGGFGLEDIIVCDLDNDSKSDLAYSYSCGSGLHINCISAYIFDTETPRKFDADTKIINVNIFLKKADNGSVRIYVDHGNTPDRLGKLVLTGKGTHKTLGVEFDTGMQNKWKKNLRIYGIE